MNYELGYGKGIQRIEIPDANMLDLGGVPVLAAERSEDQEVLRALDEPIGSLKLCEIIQPGEKIAIVTSDITRPMPTAKVMPALLNELYRGGARPEDITLVFATIPMRSGKRWPAKEPGRKYAAWTATRRTAYPWALPSGELRWISPAL